MKHKLFCYTTIVSLYRAILGYRNVSCKLYFIEIELNIKMAFTVRLNCAHRLRPSKSIFMAYLHNWRVIVLLDNSRVFSHLRVWLLSFVDHQRLAQVCELYFYLSVLIVDGKIRYCVYTFACYVLLTLIFRY